MREAARDPLRFQLHPDVTVVFPVSTHAEPVGEIAELKLVFAEILFPSSLRPACKSGSSRNGRDPERSPELGR